MTIRERVTIQRGGRVEVERPELPAGSEAEVVITVLPVATESPTPQRRDPEALSPAQRQALAALDELRSMKLTKEEEAVLDGFETFRREHPIRLASLSEAE